MIRNPNEQCWWDCRRSTFIEDWVIRMSNENLLACFQHHRYPEGDREYDYYRAVRQEIINRMCQ